MASSGITPAAGNSVEVVLVVPDVVGKTVASFFSEFAFAVTGVFLSFLSKAATSGTPTAPISATKSPPLVPLPATGFGALAPGFEAAAAAACCWVARAQ